MKTEKIAAWRCYVIVGYFFGLLAAALAGVPGYEGASIAFVLGCAFGGIVVTINEAQMKKVSTNTACGWYVLYLIPLAALPVLTTIISYALPLGW